MRQWILLACLVGLSACAKPPEPVIVPHPPWIEPQTGWRAIVSTEDAARLAGLPESWKNALAAARRYQKQIAGEGDLLVPDAARNHAAPPPGSYRCRLVKLGTAIGREPAFRVFSDFFCYIRGDDNNLFFTKQTGSELPGGWLHPDGNNRFVMTGAKQRPGGETLVYGSEPERDLVGVVERIGPFRWRLVLPWRGTDPGLDVYELTPVPVEQQAIEPRSSRASLQ